MQRYIGLRTLSQIIQKHRALVLPQSNRGRRTDSYRSALRVDVSNVERIQKVAVGMGLCRRAILRAHNGAAGHG